MGVPEDRTETAEDQENNAKETMGKNATEEQNDEVLINIEDDGLTNNKVANGDETEAEKQSFRKPKFLGFFHDINLNLPFRF